LRLVYISPPWSEHAPGRPPLWLHSPSGSRKHPAERSGRPGRGHRCSRRPPARCAQQARDGSAIDQSYVRHPLPRLAAKAGIEKRVHAHALRHAYAASLERKGATIQ